MKEKLSTIEKGDDFEARALGIVLRLIKESQISHLPEHIKIYTKKDKGYYSSIREKKIFFDLTLEVWPPNAQRSSFTYFIECKNYNGPIPVGQVSKFAEDVREVAGLNCKAIFIANTRLQEGGYNIAKNLGLMLIQGESAEDFNIILHKSSQANLNDAIPILKSTFNSSVINESVAPLEKLIDNVIQSAFKELEESAGTNYNIDRLSKDNIIYKAEKELILYDPEIFNTGRIVDINKLKNYLNETYNVEIKQFSTPSYLLGNCDFSANTISLNSSIVNTKRELFVLGHEMGHYLLHHSLRIGQTTYESFEDSLENFRTQKRDLKNPKHWIEWQANQFASSFIMPRVNFLARLWYCQNEIGIKNGPVYLDNQEDNQKNFYKIVARMSYFFNVTKTSIIYKLKEMDLIEDKSRLMTIGQLIDEYIEDLRI